MKQNTLAKISFFLLGLAVLIGAFGAHGLKNLVEEKYLETYKTGVLYHFFHALGLLALSRFDTEKVFRKTPFFILSGMLIFSFCCYFYTITQIKIFAMIVPIGGVLMATGWFVAMYENKIRADA